MRATRAGNPNVDMMELAARLLGSLVDEVVFLGGCATGLLLTDTAAPEVRVSFDIDVISEISTYIEYQQFAGRLRDQGFREDTSDGAPLWSMARRRDCSGCHANQ